MLPLKNIILILFVHLMFKWAIKTLIKLKKRLNFKFLKHYGNKRGLMLNKKDEKISESFAA
jgi:hypothetical protein